MKRLAFSLAAIGCASWLSVLPSSINSARAQESPPEPAPAAVTPADAERAENDNVEMLTRGPVHEAYAQAVTPASEDGLLIDKKPPEMIEEIPPGERPAGDNIAWIPGYWGWDDERKDFIWISGIWRAMPPGREWVPGYWNEVSKGYQWIPGYWADMKTTEVEYLPEPPETVDAGPNTQSPTGEEIWIPGVWVYQQDRYVWRAGYWAKGHQNWIWTNAHYCYTPRGYVYIPGYWDYSLQNRGILYAPAYFSSVPRGFVYSPRMVINTGVFSDHLFLRPTYRHYYFGDFYAANYRGRGILPWFVFNNSRYGYDPIYSYNHWRHRDDRDWARRVESRYENLRDSEDGRPPRTYADWQKRGRDRDNDRNALLAASAQDLAKVNTDLNWRLNKISDDARRNTGRLSRDLDDYRQQRMKLEASKTARSSDDKAADKVRLLKPPIANEADDRPAREGNRAEGRNENREGADRPGRDLPGREGAGRDEVTRPGRDLPAQDKPGQDNPTRNTEDLPGRDVPRPERAESGRGDDAPPKLDRPPMPRNETPRNETRDDNPAEREPVVPKADRPTERGTDPRDLPREAPRRPGALPGPLNDTRNPPRAPGDARDIPDRPNRERDTPGPMNDPRSRSRDLPKNSPRIERDIPKTESPRTLPSSPDVPRTPRVDSTPRVNPAPVPREVPRATPAPAPRETPRAAPAPRETPRAAPAPRPAPQPASPRPNRGGEGKGNPGKVGGKGD